MVGFARRICLLQTRQSALEQPVRWRWLRHIDRRSSYRVYTNRRQRSMPIDSLRHWLAHYSPPDVTAARPAPPFAVTRATALLLLIDQ